MASQSSHDQYMQMCLDLANKASGQTSPNPLVGAVVLDCDGNIVGQGYHERAGMPHAEPAALAVAGTKARGGTIYVNLEPCCHQGRTPPCADALIASGIKSVIVGTGDPFDKVQGGGLAKLRAAGISVTVGVMERECRYINRGFFKSVQKGLPWLELKLAATLDGRIADCDGLSRYVTSQKALEYVQKLRSEVDCIIVGARTARLDNPKLTVRMPDNSDSERQPLRAVIDPYLTTRPDSELARGGKTILYCLNESLGDAKHFDSDSIEIVPVSCIEGTIAKLSLTAVMQDLNKRGMRRVLSEGGGVLAGGLLDEDLVDQLYWFVAPKLLADQAASPAVASTERRCLPDAIMLEDLAVESYHPDFLFTALISGRAAFIHDSQP
ncbi:MAG: bifunctional diaminohydroxyphosphoribosylaminopyrimidine deaminase/5-amino-6-(5-phosphoribosylamino)uracil reductase RibD [Candidatus Obscuribacter sp.]|nr:bifunctional diaminohydroxyphosphoribosylaminopyrimidine deaminase/5-amino-6-(5-phosphoribosylamino)uracil reductase RibD [Candidatus Obscuribacter sp.]MBK9772263.1 bifunctional diaminohydroxyphosphoribosylaminopyrimidine deaminase/5-amino-6-(5-phosphoribosylamino)uracil reductase RibD [Candidatus Obscuribacter sp.]